MRPPNLKARSPSGLVSLKPLLHLKSQAGAASAAGFSARAASSSATRASSDCSSPVHPIVLGRQRRARQARAEQTHQSQKTRACGLRRHAGLLVCRLHVSGPPAAPNDADTAVAPSSRDARTARRHPRDTDVTNRRQCDELRSRRVRGGHEAFTRHVRMAQVVEKSPLPVLPPGIFTPVTAPSPPKLWKTPVFQGSAAHRHYA